MSISPPPAIQGFRPEIEGLRAIAILLVIAAHFGIPGFSAGFIGVDIFFVISGYLITSILVREYDSHGRINLPRFYANRLRRLFPALAVMVIVSSAVAYYLLPPMQQIGAALITYHFGCGVYCLISRLPVAGTAAA